MITPLAINLLVVAQLLSFSGVYVAWGYTFSSGFVVYTFVHFLLHFSYTFCITLS